MADCPYVKYDGATWFSYDHFYCELCGKKLTESEAKFKCKPDSGYAYEQCPIYKNR